MKGVGIRGAGLLPPTLQGATLGLPVFNFDLSKSTFTPSMAKRDITVGPFDIAPIVQGKMDGSSTGDLISAVRGTRVVRNFYANIDGYQGSISFWITPEWNGNLAGDAPLLLFVGGQTWIIKEGTNLRALIGSVSLTTSIAGWLAGDTHHVVIRWDKNRLDGTNYMCISLDDVHVFGGTTIPAFNSDASFSVGSMSGINANAVIQGLTIYRRPLFDGQYGADVGNGDEIALTYAAGVGKDPCEITGSWDVTFCFPTNQTAGALVTNSVDAWSHPYLSNVLTDGWLSAGMYNNQWAVLFNGTSTLINCGSDAGLDNLADNAFTVESWIRTEGAGYQDLATKRVGASGWDIRLIVTTGVLVGYIYCATTNAITSDTIKLNDGKWHHVAMTFDDAGDRQVHLWIDGVESLAARTAGVGAINPDAANTLFLGSYSNSDWFAGSMGWTRISNNVRYVAAFSPPPVPPAPDGNTLAQWNMEEGTGVTVDNEEGTVARDGTITAGTWQRQWVSEGTPVHLVSLSGGATVWGASFGSGATIDDLADNAFTAEGWFRADRSGVNRVLLHKGGFLAAGWSLYFNTTNQLIAKVECAGTDATVTATALLHNDSVWHHVAMTFDDAGDRKVRLWVDGVLVGTSAAGVGAIVADAATNLYAASDGAAASQLLGGFDWLRISNSIRYTTSFAPASRANPPAVDGNTRMQVNVTEEYDVTLTDLSGNANHGTLSGGYTWRVLDPADYQSPGERIFNWGQIVGSDAVNEGIKQVIAGAAGANYVIRALGFTEPGYQGQPRIVVRDETNGADITTLDGIWQYQRVANGDFAAGDTLWAKGVGWTIAAGVAHCDGTQVALSALSQTLANMLHGGCSAYARYRVTYTISGWAAGTVYPTIGNGAAGVVRGADGTYTDYLQAVPAIQLNFFADVDFVGDIDNITVYFVPEFNHPEMMMLSFELPTIARNGVAADCVSYSVKLLNAAASGVVGWHQCELLPNILDNPSFEVGAGVPWIPAAWANVGLDAGDALQEVVDVHSTGSAWRYLGIAGEYITITLPVVSGLYYCVTLAGKSVTPGKNSLRATHLMSQRVLNGIMDLTFTAPYWKVLSGVGRNTAGGARPYTIGEMGAGEMLVDDVSSITLSAVTLTVTPASLANSIESTGIRVDGLDTLTQPTALLKPTSGIIRFYYTPRHSPANVAKWGVSTPVPVSLYADAGNYISLYWTTPSLNLAFRASGSVAVTNTVNMTGIILANTTHLFKIVYNAVGVKCFIDGVLRLQCVGPLIFAIVPPIAYWGHGNLNMLQSDVTFR